MVPDAGLEWEQPAPRYHIDGPDSGAEADGLDPREYEECLVVFTRNDL